MPLRKITLTIACLFIVTAFTKSSFGQDRPAGPGMARQGQEVVTKVYALRDLVSATSFAATPQVAAEQQGGDGGGVGGGGGGGEGGGAGGRQRGPIDEPESRAEQIIDLITSTVDPDSWMDNGGSLGSINYVPWAKSLVITHTPLTHERIARLLAELAPKTRVLTLHMRLVDLDAAALAEKVEVRDGVSTFTGDAESLKTSFTSRATGFEGERQTLSSGREIPYIANITPVVAANAIGYQPTIGLLNDGVTLEATTELANDARSARLSLHGTFQHVVNAPRPATQPAGAPEMSAILSLIERPVVQRQVVDTRLRVPVNTWIIVGTAGATSDAAGETARPQYLLVRIDTGGEGE